MSTSLRSLVTPPSVGRSFCCQHRFASHSGPSSGPGCPITTHSATLGHLLLVSQAPAVLERREGWLCVRGTFLLLLSSPERGARPWAAEPAVLWSLRSRQHLLPRLAGTLCTLSLLALGVIAVLLISGSVAVNVLWTFPAVFSGSRRALCDLASVVRVVRLQGRSARARHRWSAGRALA